ncbi:class I SAM-dependent methyltransferase [Chamaesiphon polymorphus]|uniref:SAM-dependent methyltransferase n=1 Tax=Chamaesiphon polymorphus CCALA 037 TaxID=2107692 RepID=A0A2T1G9Q2_9CYAN|nr:class I SAM-dependent methyltransferase [Chamaesiphon polymorphus]PSB53903.1 SAM-dependent methyltransferase [Chamaesiphon polymorphus CCALA 037]
MSSTTSSTVALYLTSDACIDIDTEQLFDRASLVKSRKSVRIPICDIPYWSPGMIANATFFGDPEFGPKYFRSENSSEEFGNRWRAAIGNWDDKIVVDIGCGSGNVYAAVGGLPRSIFGIDISYGALEHAMQLGYTPLLADAHNLPLIDGFADIVTLNAVLHHCDDMARVLSQAARIVKPGGLLITDEDPLANMPEYRGLALPIRAARKRFPMYWLPGRSTVYTHPREEALRLATELHNRNPGDGVTPALYIDTLEPLGFSIELYPHYHNVGDELFQGDPGRMGFTDNLIKLLCGSNAPPAPQSIACIARKAS